MIRPLLLALALIGPGSCIIPTVPTGTAYAQMPRDVLDSLRAEVEGADVPKVIAALHDVTEFDDECDAATKIVVTYRGELAHLFLVIEGKPCAVVTGPAEGVRRLLLDVQGRPI